MSISSECAQHKVRVFPFAGDGKWYWQDADCSEPMGPFDSYRDAWRDYKALRKSYQQSTEETP